jgi:hypothetical protein
MGVRATGRRVRGFLRLPTVGEVVAQLLSQGVVFGVGAAVVHATGSPLLWWAVAAMVAAVAARGITVLREPPSRARSAWGVAVYPGPGRGAPNHAPAAGLTGYTTFGGGLNGAAGGGEGGC